MQRHDNPYNLFPKEKFYVRMIHCAPGMKVRMMEGKEVILDKKKDCDNSKYLSILEVRPRLSNGEVDWDAPVLQVRAKCAAGDTPSRSTARSILRMKAQAAAEVLGWL